MDDCVELNLTSVGPQHTEAMGRLVGENLSPGCVLALVGTLGAGKTMFARGVAAGNRIPADCTVSSPTFALVNEYPGTLTLFHLDAYRLSGAMELDALGFDEMCESGGAVMVEWADRVEECIPGDHLRINFEVLAENTRVLRIAALGERSAQIVEKLERAAKTLLEST
jgi:tRNA threonylcarbamoyladenosine biosynthesis protein TsaE